MAVTAIDAVVADVMFVTELNWLLTLNPLSRVPGRTVDRSRHEECGNQYEDRTEYADLRQRIGAVMENLWHAAAKLTQ